MTKPKTFRQFQEYCSIECSGDMSLPPLLEFLGGWDAAISACAGRQIDDDLRVHFLTLAAPAISAQLLFDIKEEIIDATRKKRI